MVLSIVERIKGFLVSPSKTFDASKEDTVGDAFKYFAAILVIYAVIIAVIAADFLRFTIFVTFQIPSPKMGTLTVVAVSFILVLVSGIIGVFIGGLWLHIWVYLVGGRKGVGQTIKALMYGATPNYLLGWIPFVILLSGWRPIAILGGLGWFIFAIWTLIVGIVGIRQLHELSTGKAVLAVILTIVIPLIIYIAIIAVVRFGGY